MFLKLSLFIAFLLLTNINAIAQEAKFSVIGHRGAMGYETENSIKSIQKALELEVDMIEIDVFKTKDNHIVVFHDDQLDRLTNETGSIEQKTLAELKNIQLIGGHQIPTLIEVLNTINKKCPLNIELKGANTASLTCQIINTHFKNTHEMLKKIVISSFNWDELRKTRAIQSKIPIAVLTEENPLDAITFAKNINAIAINPNYTILNRDMVKKIHQSNLKVYPWTVNDVDDIQNMQRIGVDGIFCNFPDRVTKDKK